MFKKPRKGLTGRGRRPLCFYSPKNRWETVLQNRFSQKKLEAAIKEKEENNFTKEERTKIKLFKKDNKIKNDKKWESA